MDKFEEVSVIKIRNPYSKVVINSTNKEIFPSKAEIASEEISDSPLDTLRLPSNPINYTFDPFYRPPGSNGNVRVNQGSEKLIMTEIPAKYGKMMTSSPTSNGGNV